MYTTLVLVGVTLTSMNGIDDITGTMSVSGQLNLKWYDLRLSWNSSIADAFTAGEKLMNANFIFLPSDWVWTPDIIIENSITTDFGPANVLLSPSGKLRWFRPFTTVASCDLDLDLYPFDSQRCSLSFRSGSYWITSGINLTEYKIPTGDPFALSKPFKSAQSWKTTGIIGKYSKKFAGSGIVSFITVDVSASRYTTYYFTIAIIPSSICAAIAIIALWITDLPTRLSVEITVLLTIMAVMVITNIFP